MGINKLIERSVLGREGADFFYPVTRHLFPLSLMWI